MLKTAVLLTVVAFVGLMVSVTSATIGTKLPLVYPFIHREQSNQVEDEAVKIDFEETAEANRWRTVDDTVMGGASQGSFTIMPAGVGVFSGELSLENSGGFSSVKRNVEAGDLEGVDAIALRLRGDGRRYQFRLKMDRSDRTLSHRAEFDTQADEWLTVSLPLESFEPVFRGRIVEDAPPLAAERVQEMSLLLAGKQTGEFRLEIDWIEGE
ncbi:MAG: CIA30 family protein [Phormidesmis sp.]